MFRQRQYCLALLFILVFSFVCCCLSSCQDDPSVRNGSQFQVDSYGDRDFRRFNVHAASPKKVVNVDNFGAKADGTDDSEAFLKAWNQTCSSKRKPVLVIPENKIYHLKPVTFSGPCKSHLTMKIHGTIKATVHQSDYKEDPRRWIKFVNVTNFMVEGGGTINGNGKIWWRNSCKVNETLPCKDAPTAVTFHKCKRLSVRRLRFKNSQQMHLSFEQCVNVKALNLNVIASGKSPNTDGIHVSHTKNIRIKNCVIRTGDDCISIVSGSKNVRATGIICGPGHGISIGSLGAGNSKAEVSNVVINRAKLTGTTNGVRIKTWQGGSGYAKNIIFKNIKMSNVSNPVIINQNYCDHRYPCKEQGQQASAVQISNVLYKNIKGTSASEVAINLNCSESRACQGILLKNVVLESHEKNETVKASCLNVKLKKGERFWPYCS